MATRVATYTFLVASAAAFSAIPMDPTEPVSATPEPEPHSCPSENDGFMRAGCDSKVASNTTTAPMAGGTLYVYDAMGDWEWSAIVDLGDAAITAGCTPRHKPHMVLPSPNQLYVAVSYTGDKFVHIIDSATKKVVMCLDASYPTPGVVGGAIHTGEWRGNDHFVMVDMTGSVNGVAGGALHKWQLDFSVGMGYFQSSLAIGPTKEARNTTETKPIAMGTNPLGDYQHLFFVTDAKGAGSIVDVDSMTVVKDLPLADFGACTGGGLWTVPHPEDPEVLVAQYGSQDGAECLYQINLKHLAITKTYALPAGADDAHGIAFCKAASTGTHYLLNTNRASATLDVLDYETGAVVVDSFDLNAPFAKKVLQPDVIFYRDGTLYMAARGPEPVSAVKAQNFFADATPGLFKLSLTDCAAPAYAADAFLLTQLDRVPAITSDVHSLWGVGPSEIWAIDQAATGSVQTYEVFSKCGAYAAD